jgi:hypothetical protein
MLVSTQTIPPDVKIQKLLTSIHIEEWLRDDFFQFKWWLLLCLIAGALLIWWIGLDKSRAKEISLFAALITILAMGIFEWGDELVLWDFPIDIIAVFPPLSSLNLISIPLIYSLTYQRYKTWPSFILAAVVITAIICFAFEPILARAGLYEMIKWRYYYSFPIYFAAAITVKAIVDKTINIQNDYKHAQNHSIIQ